MLYLITEGKGKGQKTKVGITKSERSLKRRLENLQSGNSRKLAIHSLFVNNDRQLEQNILQHFQSYCCAGGKEWLNLKPAVILEYIAALELESYGKKEKEDPKPTVH